MAKVMISIPDELLERLDARAKEREMSRSALLREAAEEELGRPTAESIRRALEEGQRLFADAGSFDSADLIRKTRDERTRRDEDLL